MKNSLKVVAIILMFLSSISVRGQKLSLEVNFADLLNYGTLNCDAEIAIQRHLSIYAGGRYNGWDFKTKDQDILVRNQQKTAFCGIKYWPWYVNSGSWFAAKSQLLGYSQTGIWRPALDEGCCLGLGLSMGYSWMLNRHFNLDVGLGLWGGRMLKHFLYCCPDCMVVRSEGPEWFLSPDDVILSLKYIF